MHATGVDETTMALNCVTLGVASNIPGLTRIVGAPSYPGLPGPVLAKWGLGKLKEKLPMLASSVETLADYVVAPLMVANSAAITAQCYGDKSNRSGHW